MYATFSFRFSSGSRSLKKLDQLTFNAKWAAVRTRVQTATPITTRRVVGLRSTEPPAHRAQPLALPDQLVPSEADHANHQHRRDHEVVSLARVARVDHEVSEARVDGDHFRRDDDDPRDTERDAQSGENAG